MSTISNCEGGNKFIEANLRRKEGQSNQVIHVAMSANIAVCSVCLLSQHNEIENETKMVKKDRKTTEKLHKNYRPLQKKDFYRLQQLLSLGNEECGFPSQSAMCLAFNYGISVPFNESSSVMYPPLWHPSSLHQLCIMYQQSNCTN